MIASRVQDPDLSGGPPKLDEVERNCLKKWFSTSTPKRHKSGELLRDPLIEEGMDAELGY